jgi:hypothetical protein
VTVQISRSFPLTYARWHPVVSEVPKAPGIRSGGSVVLAGVGVRHPTGKVTQAGTDHPYQGMDPSVPLTYVRPYRPAAGMIAYLNYDGAMPNKTQTVANPPRSWAEKRPRLNLRRGKS